MINLISADGWREAEVIYYTIWSEPGHWERPTLTAGVAGTLIVLS